MEALSQAYSGIQQYAAAALPSLYNQSLLSQQSVSAAGSQKEGGLCWQKDKGFHCLCNIYLEKRPSGMSADEES